VHWSAQYSGTLRTEHTLTSFNFGPNFGLRGFGNSPEEFEYKRFKAKANYFYLRADAQHERPLLWGSRVFLRAAGQYAADPLISNEQFSMGGADSVRGYLESAELGDNGAYGTLELRSPQLLQWLPDRLQPSYAFVFGDAGVVGILDPLLVDGEKVSRKHLYSWGAGIRLAGFGGLEADLDWAYPLRATDNTQRGDSRLHFRVRYGF
jgi:hemolysin activation/secretion protein